MEKDEVQPDCHPEGPGCRIPPRPPESVHAFFLRDKFLQFRELMAPPDVIRIYGASKEDLEVLGLIEDTYREMKDNAGQ